MLTPMTTVVYTDGACSGNPGPGGWAWAVPGGRWAAGFAPGTTNQRMEVTAALEAIRSIEGPVEVVSDSTYVVNCFRDRWWEGWIARGWKNKAKKDVANQDLWRPLIELYRSRADEIEFSWVKGHSDDVMNDLVDKLAVRAALLQEAESGEGVPVVDVEILDPRVPPGHRIVALGHRPPGLGGYDENPVAAGVRRRLAEILTAKLELHPDAVVLTGLGLGAEQLAAEAALEAPIPFAAVLPYPDQDSVWPAASRARHQALLAAAGAHGRAAGPGARQPPASRRRALASRRVARAPRR